MIVTSFKESLPNLLEMEVNFAAGEEEDEDDEDDEDYYGEDEEEIMDEYGNIYVEMDEEGLGGLYFEEEEDYRDVIPSGVYGSYY
jgi:hypothetical protein